MELKKCLVTRLQESVDDSSLTRLNELVMKVNGSSNAGDISLRADNSPVSVRIISGQGTFITNGLTTISSDGTSNLWAGVNADSVIGIIPKYDISYMATATGSLSVDDAKYLNIPTNGTLNLYALSGNLEEMNHYRSFKVSNAQYDLYGDLVNYINGAPSGEYELPYEIIIFNAFRLTGNLNILDASKTSKIKVFRVEAAQTLSGDITAFNASNMPSLETLSINFGHAVSGNVSTFRVASTCTSVNFGNCENITGSAQSFRTNNPQVTTFTYSGSGITV